ncbi:uncharacterized protein LOC134243403 [Saccostrea cucullata]|uniref:uncharacterized protein LOC134243403 n=1 Tax=Saccostrea cuccullata TaxID=36930 RepID=UPI002ED32B19
MPKEYKCFLCGKHHIKIRRPIRQSPLRKYASKLAGQDPGNDDVICNKCRKDYYNSIKKHSSASVTLDNDNDSDFCLSADEHLDNNSKEVSPKNIHLNIPSTHSSHKFCVVCRKKSSKRVKFCTIPLNARTQAFIHNGIFIKQSARCCSSHLEGKNLLQSSLTKLQAKYANSFFNRTDLFNLLENVRLTLKRSSILDFDNSDHLSTDEYYNLTGLTKEQFQDLTCYAKSIRPSAVRSVNTCLAILLTKLRTGLPNHILGTIFSLKKCQIQRSIHSARMSLRDFVSQNVGFNHISHEDFVNKHTTPIAKKLFCENEDNTAIIVLDGTYIFIQKSSDYKFQRQSYNLHKHRPLVKPMVVVGTDGYILSVQGPYLSNARNSDAAITKHMVTVNSEGMNDWLQDKDLCIVDRGFRDVVQFLEEKGLCVEMPVFLKKGSKQHTTEEANTITKIRWIVESINGKLKQWRFFDKVVPNLYLPHLGEFLQIVAAICNKYHSPPASNQCDIQLAEEMLEKSRQGNLVQTMVENEGLLRKRTIYTDILSHLLKDFPVLTEEKLRKITLGVYQLKQAPRYAKEHINNDNEYQLQVCKIKENLLKVRIQSRHCNNISHTSFIQYTTDGQISGWYCTCKVGARVVGCCAHIASIIWYLGYQRFQQHSPEKFDFCNSVLDACDISDSECSSSVEE